MILIDRGLPDRDGAEGLKALELTALAALRLSYQPPHAHPTSAEIERFDYTIAGTLLWKRQGRHCAYCEHPEQRRRNDVEHFRPKGRALRGASFPANYGYWWLAWRWQNLLFACRNCNQAMRDLRAERDARGTRGKVDRFPLDGAGGLLTPEQDPYGAQAGVERPLLIDPGSESGLDHIEFRRDHLPGGAHQWRPYPRDGSPRGEATIYWLGLDREDLLEAYNAHIEREVEPSAKVFLDIPPGSTDGDRRMYWERMESRLYRVGSSFRALSYDALALLVDDTALGGSIPRGRPLP